ncbi:recombinase family protein [Actinoplanes cyaneus]|nr:recombinase family protein [Actinoplanes cyaneus]
MLQRPPDDCSATVHEPSPVVRPASTCSRAAGELGRWCRQARTPTMSKMFFTILATLAEFEVDLLRMRTREGMTVARAKGKNAATPSTSGGQ